MLSAFAEFKNNLRKKHQADGIKNAVKFGRSPKLNESLCQSIYADRESGIYISKSSLKYQLCYATAFRAIKKAKGQS